MLLKDPTIQSMLGPNIACLIAAVEQNFFGGPLPLTLHQRVRRKRLLVMGRGLFTGPASEVMAWQYIKFFNFFMEIEKIIFLDSGLTAQVNQSLFQLFSDMCELLLQYYWPIRNMFDGKLSGGIDLEIFYAPILNDPAMLNGKNLSYMQRLGEDVPVENFYFIFSHSLGATQYRSRYVDGRKHIEYFGCEALEDIQAAQRLIIELINLSGVNIDEYAKYEILLNVTDLLDIADRSEHQHFKAPIKLHVAFITLYFQALNSIMRKPNYLGKAREKLPLPSTVESSTAVSSSYVSPSPEA